MTEALEAKSAELAEVLKGREESDRQLETVEERAVKERERLEEELKNLKAEVDKLRKATLKPARDRTAITPQPVRPTEMSALPESPKVSKPSRLVAYLLIS